jgi:4a-hydroxytetrahydrobiopterin dehydratase
MALNLENKHCVPCEGGVAKLSHAEMTPLLQEVPGWRLTGDKLTRTFAFENFKEAMSWVNVMAAVAEMEQHHPDFCVHYNRVEVSLWTHATGGLSQNDFILAAKLSQLPLIHA